MTALPDGHMQHQLLHLAETVKDDYGRMELSSMWRPYGRYMTQSTSSKPMGIMSRGADSVMQLLHALKIDTVYVDNRLYGKEAIPCCCWMTNQDKVAVSILVA